MALNPYEDYLKRKNEETKYGQAVPYKYGDDMVPQGFWADAQEKIKEGWRIVPLGHGRGPEKKPQALWLKHRMPTQDDMWVAGRPGAYALGSEGKSYEEMDKEVLLARYPGAIDVLESGNPWYGGNTDHQETDLRIRAQLKYGTRYIDDLELTSQQSLEFDVAGNVATRMQLAKKAYLGYTEDLADKQDEKFLHATYEGIYEKVGQYWHQAGAKSVDLMEAGLANGYLLFSGDETYKKAWNKYDEQVKGDVFTKAVYNPLGQLMGATMHADLSEFLFFQTMPWNWGKENNIHSLSNAHETTFWLQQHPGVSEAVAKNLLVNQYWSSFAYEWLNPFVIGVDLVTDIVFPKTFAFLGAKAIGKIFPRIARRGAKVTPELARLLSKTDELGDAARLGGIGDDAFYALKNDGLIDAFMKDKAETVANLGKWEREKGIFSKTAETKAMLTAQDAQDGVRWITNATQGQGEAEFMRVMELVGNIGSEDKGTIEAAWRELSRLPNFDYWFSQSGQSAATLVNKMWDVSSSDLAKLKREIDEIPELSKKAAKLLVWTTNESNRVATEMFPTLEKALEAGRKLSPELVAAEKAHRGVRKLLDPAQRFFSAWYLGRTPGYAVRNGVQNFGQTIWDLGITSTTGILSLDDAFDWAGADIVLEAGERLAKGAGDDFLRTIVRDMAGIAGAAGEQYEGKGVKKFFDMRYWSGEILEKASGRGIFGSEYPKEMRRVLSKNLSKQFKAAGVDNKTAKYLERAIIENKGSVSLARKQIEKTVSDGFFRNVGIDMFSPDIQKKAESYNLVSRLHTWVDDADSFDDFAKSIDQWVDDLIDSATDTVKKEGATSPGANIGYDVGNTANEVMTGNAPRKIHEIMNSTGEANKLANRAVDDAITTTREEIVAGLRRLGKSDVEARSIFSSWANEVDLVVDGDKAAAVGKMRGDDFFNAQRFSPYENPRLNDQHKSLQTVFEQKKDDLARVLDDPKDLSTRLKEFWTKELAESFGEYNGQDKYEIRRALFRQRSDNVAVWWNDWTEQNYNMARQVAEHVLPKASDAGVQVRTAEHMFSNASKQLENAHKYQKWLPEGQLNYAIDKAVEMKDEGKRLYALAVEYSNKYGIDNTFIKEGREFTTHKKLVSIINKQLGTDFDELKNMKGITRLDIQEAMKNHSLGRYRNIVDKPEDAIDLLLKVTDAGPFGNTDVMKRLTAGEMKELRRFRDLLVTANPAMADELSNAINVRRKLPSVTSATDHDGYNELAKMRDEADEYIKAMVDKTIELMAEKTVDSKATKWTKLAKWMDGTNDEIVKNLRDMDDMDLLLDWLKDADPDLYRSFGRQMAMAGTADNIADIVKFPAVKPDDIPTFKISGDDMTVLKRATKKLTPDQVDSIDQPIADALVKAQKKIDASEKSIAEEAKRVSALIDKKVDDSTEYIARSHQRSQVDADDFVHLWGGEDAPTKARVVWESQDEIREFAATLKTGYKSNWDNVVQVTAGDPMLNSWDKVEDIAKGMVSEARMGAFKTVREKRDFILHNYGDRRNFDTLLAYLYPYHFWHSRNAANWFKRVANRPMLGVAYQHYKDRMEIINADMPEWYKQNVRITGIMGYDDENPLMINVEALVSPVYQALKAANPFNDRNKRDTQFARMLDNAGRVSSTHTLFSLMYGAARYVQGDKVEGAAWMGRLIPQTKVTTMLTSVAAEKMGIDKWKRGIELDPVIGLQGAIEQANPAAYFSALDPYEQKRIAVAYQSLVQMGKYTDEEVVDAIMADDPDHPLTVEAHGLAQSRKNLGDMASFIGTPAFQIRSKDEREIMRMDEEMRLLFQYSDQLKPEEKAQFHQIMREKYPTYYNSVMLTRKNRDQREEAFVYNVMARIPPGQTKQIYEGVGLTYEDVQEFYESKGESLKEMPDADRVKFMAGITELSTVAAFPDAPTANEWKEAKSRMSNQRKELLAYYGEEVYAQKAKYFELLRDPAGPDKAYAYLDSNPRAADLMSDETQWNLADPLLNKYYSSFGKAKSMMNAEMYDRLEAMYPGIVTEQDDYWKARSAGSGVKASDRLQEYWADKRAMEEIYDNQLVGIGRHIPKAGTVEFPKRFDPSDLEEQDIEELSRGEQALAGMTLDKGEVPEQYDWTWAQWEEVMDPTLARLAQDWAFRGAELGKDAQKNLAYMLEPMGIEVGEAMELMRQASKEAGAQFYGPENPPWWLDE